MKTDRQVRYEYPTEHGFPPDFAHFDDKDCCNDSKELLGTVWSVLTKEERVYTRIDEIVHWLVLYIITGDMIKRNHADDVDVKYYYVARRKLWDYMGHNGEDIKAKARKHRLWTNGKKW